MTLAGKIAFVLMFVTMAFTTLAYGAVHQPIIAVFYVLTVLMLMFWAIDGVRSGNLTVETEPVILTIAAAGLYGFIQVIPFGFGGESAGVSGMPSTISLDPFATKVSALHFIALFIFAFVGLAVTNTAARLKKLTAAVAIFGFGFAFFAILQSFLSPNLIYGLYDTGLAVPFGSFVNRNNFGAVMEMMIALPLGMIFAGAVAKDKRLLYVTAVALMGVALVLSSSRGALVAFIVMLILLVLLTSGFGKKKNMAVKFGLSALLLAVIIGGVIFVGGEESSLTRIADSAETPDVSTNRGHMWRVTSDIILNNMPFGVGLGAYAVAYTKYDTLGGYERVEQAHNDFLQVVSDGGIPGIIIGGLFLFFFVRMGIKAIKVENMLRRGIAIGAFAGCSAVLVHSIFDFVLHTTAVAVVFLILLVILAAALRNYADDEIDPMVKIQKKKRRSPNVANVATLPTERNKKQITN